eukprot:tig00020964_g16794.t1
MHRRRVRLPPDCGYTPRLRCLGKKGEPGIGNEDPELDEVTQSAFQKVEQVFELFRGDPTLKDSVPSTEKTKEVFGDISRAVRVAKQAMSIFTEPGSASAGAKDGGDDDDVIDAEVLDGSRVLSGSPADAAAPAAAAAAAAAATAAAAAAAATSSFAASAAAASAEASAAAAAASAPAPAPVPAPASSPSSSSSAAAVAAAPRAPLDVATTGVLIVDHGSRRQESNEALSDFARLFRRAAGPAYRAVAIAHMEIAPPTIADGFEELAAAGCRTVVVAPYFLSAGRHWREDIPRLAAEAAAKHAGLSYIVAAPLGVDELLVQLMQRRIDACAAGEGCAACEGGPGSDFCAPRSGGGAFEVVSEP